MSNPEQWRPAVGFEGKYLVSDHGNVFSLINNKVLKAGTDKNGYRRFTLFDSTGTGKDMRANRLVLLAWKGPPPSACHFAAHNDGNNQNDVLSNLDWKTPKENSADRDKHGRTTRGVDHWDNKLTPEQVLEIRAALAAKEPQRSIARRFGIGRTTVIHIRNKRSWAHLGDELK